MVYPWEVAIMLYSTFIIGNPNVEKISEENNRVSSSSMDMDSPPVLYIAKYNRLIDTGLITLRDEGKHTTSNDMPLPSNTNEYR